ncbi:MAG: caspase family protein [Thermoguttaceae bacterium]
MRWIGPVLWGFWGLAVFGSAPTVGSAGDGPGEQPEEVLFRELIRVEAEQPRLRINSGGHIGVVHALAFSPDSTRLYSGGTDKAVEVWNLSVYTRDLQSVFLRERTIRWQVARGPLGQVYALAVDPKEGLVALAGFGAMTSRGEILLVDPKTGRLVRALEAHREAVSSLAFSPDGTWLVSSDLAGQTILWKRGDWKPETLYEPDEEQQARLIEAQAVDRRLAMFAGRTQVVVPRCLGQAEDHQLRWQLRGTNLNDRQDVQQFQPRLQGAVTALAATPDGRMLAAADWAGDLWQGNGNLYVWDLHAEGPKPQRRPLKAKVLCLGFSPDGRMLAAGTGVSLAAKGKAELQIWDTRTLAITRRRTCPDNVQACALSPDGNHVAYSGGLAGEVFYERLDGTQPARVLHGRGRRIYKVAFAAGEPVYRVAFGAQYGYRGFNDYGPLQESFDPEALAARRGPIHPEEWLPSDWGSGGWTAKPIADGTLQLFLDGQPKGRVVLDTVLVEGRPRSYCWVPDADGNPFAIAVGTEVQNSIYVCRLAQQGPCPILRHFRGHEDSVNSLGVSKDLRYLVSGAGDGTIAFWSLSDLKQGATLYGRWGAELAIAPKKPEAAQAGHPAETPPAQTGQLYVKRINPAGPLFHKGVRPGDTIVAIHWFERPGGGRASSVRAGVARSLTQPAEILEALRKLPWGTEVVFRYSRNGLTRRPFVLRPAWQPLATLFVSSDQQWAFWTPEGYYDASENGHTLFGWLVNPRTLEVLPDFYRADQFHKTLERPEVLQRLLRDGSLDEALRQAQVKPKGELQDTLTDRIARTPKVEILEPATDAVVEGDVARVRARVEIPVALEQAAEVHVRAYASGVISPRPPKRIPGRATGQKREETYEFELPLPSERRTLIQVVAGTPEVTTPREVVVNRPGLPPRAEPRRLCVLAVGINKYKDPKIGDLQGPVSDAQAVLQLLRRQSKGLYVVQTAELLTNENVTPENWRRSLQKIRDRLKQDVRPDDMLVLFLAGHGVRDPKTGKYYYLGYEFGLDDWKAGQFAQCISWEDFRILADIPCRKVALLDTCHSGAIQPRSTDAKTAVRALQDAVIFTLTAATGEQLSIEPVGAKHGIFTASVLEALEGRADGARRGEPPDSLVSLGELVEYVGRAVPQTASKILQTIPEQQRRGQHTQQPTAAPLELLPYTNQVPLTRPAGQAGRAGPAPPRASLSSPQP